MNPSEAVPCFLAAAAASLGVFFFLRRLKYREFFLLLIAVLIPVIFLHGYAREGLHDFLRGAGVKAGKDVIYGAWALLLAGALLLRNSPGVCRKITSLTAVLAVVFFAGALFRPATLLVPEKSAKPDIYYILLSAYAREDTLRELGFDNTEFLESLKADGFDLLDKSRGNYMITGFNHPAIFNMKYISSEIEADKKAGGGFDTLRSITGSSEVKKVLKENGYLYINFHSPLSFLGRDEMADLNINTVYDSHFLVTILENAIFKIKPSFEENLSLGIPKTFERLAQTPRLRSPKFVFAHIMSPHPPLLF